jgi:hypothetical protein
VSDSTSAEAMLDAAERAAAAGDLAAAEQLLRRAVRSQETQLGPLHPDLANSLNNLGVICEKTGQLDEAERCYRRACDIAAAAFEPDHPFVITSRKNLADFCESSGRTIAASHTAASAAPLPVASEVSPSAAAPAVSEDRRPVSTQAVHRTASVQPLAIAGIAVLVLVVLAAVIMRRPGGPPDSAPAGEPPAERAPVAAVTPPDAGGSPPAATAPDPGSPAKDAVPPSADSRPRSASDPEPRTASTRNSAQPTVAEARVCRRLSTNTSPDWRCEQAGPSVRPGSLVYYTRIKATGPTSVEHRWYHGDELRQRVRLPVSANQGAGYRTYSRLAVSATGAWRVEVRSTSGTLLHAERFNVR